jgi:tetratricopeptide (TPR) repeat protein
VRALSMFGLLVSLAFAPCILPAAWAQGSVADYSKAVKARFDDTKKRTDELIKRQEHIIKLFKSADPKAVESSFDEAVALIEKAIQSYDENSELWKAYDQVDTIIRDSLEDARKKSSSATARWLPIVKMWQDRQSESLKQRTDLKAQLVAARGNLEGLKQDKDIILHYLKGGAIKEAQEEIAKSIKDFEGINQNMKDMVESMRKDVATAQP